MSTMSGTLIAPSPCVLAVFCFRLSLSARKTKGVEHLGRLLPEGSLRHGSARGNRPDHFNHRVRHTFVTNVTISFVSHTAAKVRIFWRTLSEVCLFVRGVEVLRTRRTRTFSPCKTRGTHCVLFLQHAGPLRNEAWLQPTASDPLL